MKNLSSDVLPDGKMYYDIASAILNPTLENNYGLISSYVCGAMDVMNEKAGINAKARKPSYNVDKTLGLIKKVSDAEYFDDVKNYLNEPVITNALSIVDEGARVNAGLHYNMGYKPVIVRRASFGCCPWCRGLAGTYDYEDVKDTGNDVFRRHANCRCQVIYDPSNGNGEVQDVHSKEIIELNTPSKIEEEISIETIKKLPKMYFTNITGGEPFIRTDLKDIVRELYKKSDRIVISTNGFFTDRIVDLAKEFPQIGIRISIEGLEDTNNEIRGLENGYQRGYQTLKKLREMGMKDVGFGMTVQDKNAPDLVPLYNI